MKRYLLDTSIFIAIEHERAIGDPPEGSARVSVATLTELAHDLTVWTQDRDFELLAELEPALRFERA